MAKETFGKYIRRLREERNLPLRKVAAQLDVDTSTLSKVERGERPMLIDYLKPLSQILKIDYKELQVRFLADSINANYGKLEYLEDGLDEAINQLKKRSNAN
jgi:transcriptional regulator with XRE-family HTH domain